MVKQKYKYADENKIGDYMSERGYKLGNPSVFYFYWDYPTEEGIAPIKGSGRFYTLRVDDWLTPDEIKELGIK